MQQALSKSVDFLQSREGLFLVLVGALGVQAPHSAEVFHRISTSLWWAPFSMLHCIGFAIVLELAVLLFVVRGRKRLSWGFAAISVLMNVFYYYSATWWVGAAWSNLIMCVVTAIALPLAIAFYSHEVAGHEAQPEQPEYKPKAAQSKPASVQPEPELDVQPEPKQAADDGTVAKRRRAVQLRSEGLSYAQIGEELQVHRNTVGKWLREEGITA